MAPSSVRSRYIWLLARSLAIAAVALTLLVASPSTLQGQAPLSKRLYLKDGSYQGATEWKVQGKRVRYFSSERYDWEEIPSSLVDWVATDKYQRERAAAKPSSEEAKEDEEEAAWRKQEADRTPLVAPGLRLPETGGVFLLDDSPAGPVLAPLAQNGGVINRQMGKNILRSIIIPIPTTAAQQTLELNGVHAKVQSHTARPILYFNQEDENLNSQAAGESGRKPASRKSAGGSSAPSTADAWQFGRFNILRLKRTKNSRVLEHLTIGYSGSVSEQQDKVATRSGPVSGGWLKIYPLADLAPGEYALVEMQGEQMNTFVYDFGVDPHAPANLAAWKPAPAKPALPETPPQLQKRNKN